MQRAMALSAVFSPSSCRTLTTTHVQIRRTKPIHSIVISAVQSEGDNDKPTSSADAAKTNPQPSTSPPPPTKLPRKPVYSMKKGQIVRVDKEKYLNSINYLSVGHPIYFKGLDYIYEDRGEILDLRNFDTGEYALISWVGIPTAPAWLPTDMLIKSDKLDYTRI